MVWSNRDVRLGCSISVPGWTLVALALFPIVGVKARDGVHGHTSSVARITHPFAGLGLDANMRNREAKRFRKPLAHLRDIRGKLWSLQDHGCVDVLDCKARVPHEFDASFEQLNRIGIFPARLRVGEMRAEVAQGRRSE